MLLNNKMSNLRRSRHNKNERYEVAIYSDPNEFAQYTEQPNKYYPNHVKSAAIENNPFAKINLNEIVNQETYLSNLQEEIEKLKNKIDKLEDEECKKVDRRTIDHERENQVSDVLRNSRTRSIQSRNSNVGRIYNRGSTPSQGKRVPKYISKEKQSTYYKWTPQIDGNESNPLQSKQKKVRQDNLNPNSQENTNKPASSYRVKQKSVKQPVQQTNLLKPPLVQQQKKDVLKKKFKTEKIHSQLDDSPILQKGKPKKDEQKQIAKEIPTIVEQPEQLKEVLVMKPQWEITSITDDFRVKMTSKLQIPQGFPLDTPNANDPLETHEKRSAQIYKLFNLNVQRFKEKLVVRKFKNGVYYQMKPNKNIVWYLNGAFYFGDWDTDLPSEAEKNGFGFQYIPNRYYYIGQFKNGNRNGKGVLKLINKNSTNPNEFLAYDCLWSNGKPHGQGKQIDEKNNKYIGTFENGEKTGRAIILNRDGLYYEGEIKNGIKHGQGVQKLINGDVYSGNFIDGKFSGIGCYNWKNGSSYEGQFVNGKRQGKGIWKSFNGDVFEGQYSNDIKHGWGKFSWKNGQIYQGQFKNDIRDGLGSYKHPNGKLGRYIWKDGRIDHRVEQQSQILPSEFSNLNKQQQFSP